MATAAMTPNVWATITTGHVGDRQRCKRNAVPGWLQLRRDQWACLLAGSANTERRIHSNATNDKAGTMAQRKKRPAVRKRTSIARRQARKPSKSARKGPAKRSAARATPRKRPAKAKLKPGAKKARKRVRAVKPPSTPAVETVVTEAKEVAPEPSLGPEEPEESRSEPPESEER